MYKHLRHCYPRPVAGTPPQRIGLTPSRYGQASRRCILTPHAMPNCPYCGDDVARSTKACPKCGPIDVGPSPLWEVTQGGLLLLLTFVVFIVATVSAAYFLGVVGDLFGMNE